MSDLNELGLVELNDNKQKEIDGGFVPLVILGVTYTAPQVAAAAGVLFAAGAAVGTAAASE
jgi:hypothetical protein